MKRSLLGLIALFSVISFSQANAIPGPGTPLEAVHVKTADQFLNLMPPVPVGQLPRTTFELNVKSNGCTDAKDFKVNILNVGDEQLVAFERIRPDRCKMVEHTISIEIQTGGISQMSKVKLLNPVLFDLSVAH